ncbi:response regulator [Paenibacillus hodogayensis]|uniref:Response regulator n=1 Tax=Paenibacillus hodogayensis TaxID=279208 RepID=A0ABV5VV28_9BACL
MRAILVDDERLALKQLKHILEQHAGDVEIVGMFSDPTEVMSAVKELEPDIAFLDIHMPALNGLQLGERLQESMPSVELIFVTGYDQYAVHAFELYALDYIMKPVQPDRLIKTVQRIRTRTERRINLTGQNERQPSSPGPAVLKPPATEEGSGTLVLSATETATEAAIIASSDRPDASGLPLICCFSQLRYRLPGSDPQPFKWRTSKAQELFAYLLHHRDRMIDRDTLIDLLWPDFELARAAQQLYTTVYHVRQTLKSSGFGMISITSGNLEAGYRLVTGGVRIDSEEWEQRVKGLSVPDSERIGEHEQVLEQYEGNYFADFEYLWAEHERERLRRLWLHHAKTLSAFHVEQGHRSASFRLYRRIQQLFPYEEDSYFGLMKLHASAGDTAGVEEQYWLLTSKIGQELESALSETITDWYAAWRAGQ